MIRYRPIAYVLGQFLLALAGTMLVPLAYGYFTDAGGLWGIGASALITAAVGGGLRLLSPVPRHELSQREGLLLVAAVWLGATLFGCLPFYFSPYFPSLADSFFEATSGFTTTGATILEQIDDLPEPLQFWRCFSHWLGGMGIVLLGIAILPLVGHGGMKLYRAEFSGSKSEKLKPRIAETAATLGKIYLAFTLLDFVVLRLLGMSAFEAACNTFSVAGTGGFSTRADSIAGFRNPALEYVLVLFMLLGGISFVQHYRLWVERRPRNVFRDVEIRAFIGLIVVVTLVFTVVLVFDRGYTLEPAFRSALFQVTSIATTTGFVTDNYDLWHPFLQLTLLAIMFVGGCTGSTSGGMKVSRILLLARVVDREFKRMVERRGVFAVRLGNEVMPESVIQSLLNLVYLAFVVNFVSCMLLAATGVGVFTSIAAVAATMFNIGPSLGAVGPVEHYAHLPDMAKWVLSFCMIAGRLEFYTVLVIFTPAFWRK